MNGADRSAVMQYAAEKLNTKPEYLFRKLPQAAVLRHRASGKWFAIIMPVSREKLGLRGKDTVDVMNVKCDPLMLGSMLTEPGFLPAYHMAKGAWVSILLDGTVPLSEVTAALHMSYALVSKKAGGRHRTEPKEWLVPANPKYEDLSESFMQQDTLYWKQSAAFIPGDILYIYEGKPIGAVTWCCEVTKTDIPYHYDQGGLHMDKVAELRLLRKYAKEQFPLERLADFGVRSVRGPRGLPDDLAAALRASGEAVQKRRKQHMKALFLWYPKCSTCKKAKAWLDANGIAYDARHIAEQNPTADELRAWQAKSGLPLRRFFNTSGMRYRELELAKRLPEMDEAEQIALLSTDGMLVKRPLLITEKGVLAGFREQEWGALLK